MYFRYSAGGASASGSGFQREKSGSTNQYAVRPPTMPQRGRAAISDLPIIPKIFWPKPRISGICIEVKFIPFTAFPIELIATLFLGAKQWARTLDKEVHADSV